MADATEQPGLPTQQPQQHGKPPRDEGQHDKRSAHGIEVSQRKPNAATQRVGSPLADKENGGSHPSASDKIKRAPLADITYLYPGPNNKWQPPPTGGAGGGSGGPSLSIAGGNSRRAGSGSSLRKMR